MVAGVEPREATALRSFSMSLDAAMTVVSGSIEYFFMTSKPMPLEAPMMRTVLRVGWGRWKRLVGRHNLRKERGRKTEAVKVRDEREVTMVAREMRMFWVVYVRGGMFLRKTEDMVGLATNNEPRP